MDFCVCWTPSTTRSTLFSSRIIMIIVIVIKRNENIVGSSPNLDELPYFNIIPLLETFVAISRTGQQKNTLQIPHASHVMQALEQATTLCKGHKHKRAHSVWSCRSGVKSIQFVGMVRARWIFCLPRERKQSLGF